MNVQFSNTSNTSYFKNIWNLSVICVGFLSPSQTPAPQPLNRPLHLVSLFFICSTHNPAPHPPFSPSNGKEDEKTTTTQQQPLLPVKLLVAPLTPLTGESKAIKMTRRQIVCDTSKGLEKAGKLSSATSSSTLRRGREEEKKHKADKHAPHGQHKHPETPALSSRPPPRPKHRLVPRDYTSNDYTIPARALRGAN